MNKDLSKMTIKEVLTYAAVGFVFEINDGKVVRMTLKGKEDHKDER